MLTKGAIGNLINRYKAVLKKCALINTFGSLAVASMLVLGGASVAGASMEGYDNVPWTELKKEIDITSWLNGAKIEATDFAEPGKSIIFGGSLVLATDYSSQGGMAPTENSYVHIDNTAITVTGDGTETDWVSLQLNAGGTAIGEGAKSSVGTSEITIGGDIQLCTRYEESSNGNNTWTYPVYTPIRGGGTSVNGGYANVDTSIININAEPGMLLEVSDIMGGGCVVSPGESGQSLTRNSIININNLSTPNLRPLGGWNEYTRIFGGGDMAEVRNAEININNCSADNLRVYGGGYAEEAGRTTVTGKVAINITGNKLHEVWQAGGKYLPAGDIVAGGYSRYEGKTSVEHTDITIKNSSIRSNIYGGGYAEENGVSYVGSSNVLITDGSLINGDGSSTDVHGGGYSYEGGKTVTGTTKLTITGGAVLRGQVFAGGESSGKGAETSVADTTAILDNGFIKASMMSNTSSQELRAGRLSGGIRANQYASGGVEYSTVIFRNSVLEGARILGGSSANSGSSVKDGTTNVFIESGVIKPMYDEVKKKLRARSFNGGGDCYNGGTSHINTANMYISGGEIQCNAYAGSDTEDEVSDYGRSYAMVDNAKLHITGGTFTMRYPAGQDKHLIISAGGDAYENSTSNVGNGTLIIDGSSGNLMFDKGTSTKGFRILAGGLAENSVPELSNNPKDWARTHVENSKVLLKNVDIVDGKVYTGGAAFTAYSTVTNSDLTLDNATVKFIAPFHADVSADGMGMGECSVENSTVTLINEAKVLENVEIEAAKSVLAVDRSIDESNVKNIAVHADERVLRLLDNVESFDMGMLGGDKWNYTASTRSGEDTGGAKLTRLEAMGQTVLSTNGFKEINDATIGGSGNTLQIGGTGEFVTETVSLSQNKLDLKEGTLTAESIALSGQGAISVNGGSLKTSSEQIFATALDSNGKNTETGGIKTALSGKLTFSSGSLALTDKKYNKTYAANALSDIRKTAEGSTATVVMLGKLMAEAGMNGSVDFEGGGDHGNHGSIDIGDTKPGNGYGDKNHVHVHWKDQLGLLGGDSTDVQLITAQNEGAIQLEVGNASEVQTLAESSESKGVVTLGSEFHASKGSLSGTATVNSGALLSVVKNGEYLIDKVELAGAGATASVQGKLGTDELTSAGGKLEVEGELQSAKLTAENSAVEISGKLIAGNMQSEGGSLSVGREASIDAGALSATGSTVNVEGSIRSDSMDTSGSDVAIEGSVDSGSFVAKNGTVKVSGNMESGSMDASSSKIDITGSLAADAFVADADTVINVGNEDSAGRLIIKENELNGAGIFLDPAWNDEDPSKNIIENASHAVISGNTVNGRLTAGQNSLLVLGDDDADAAIAAFKASARSWKSEVSAAIAIMSAQKLSASGSLLANGELTMASADAEKFAEPGTAVFKSGSLLMVNSSATASGAALSGCGGRLSVEEGAQLYIHDAKPGQSYVIVDGFSEDSSIEGWKDSDLIANRAVDVQFIFSDNSMEALPDKNEDFAKDYPDILVPNAINALEIKSDSEIMGVRFLSKALNPALLSDEEFVGVTNEVAHAAVTAGVQNTSLRIADAASNTVLGHMSLSQHDGSKAIHASGVDFWAAPMYGNLYTSGMVTSGSSVRGQFGGLALGADLEAGQFLGGKFRLGAAINGGGGQSETKGNVTSTQNDYDFGGLNFYAGWNSGALNVIASVGYGFGNHEVEMGIPVTGIGSAKADIDTSAFTADLRAEYQLKTPYVDILPHAGIRYTALKTDAHDLKANGSVLNSVESDTQNIVQFPVGVTLSKDFDLAGWNVKPMADVSIIPATGDKKASTKVNFSGLDAWDSVNTRVMDSTSWAGTVGIQAEKGNMTFGLNYGVQASSNETDQNIQVKFGWKF